MKISSLARGDSLSAHNLHPAFDMLRRLPAKLCVPYLADDLFWSLFQKPTS
jgi:hypothetical protein